MTHVVRSGCTFSVEDGLWSGLAPDIELGRCNCRIFESEPVEVVVVAVVAVVVVGDGS